MYAKPINTEAPPPETKRRTVQDVVSLITHQNEPGDWKINHHTHFAPGHLPGAGLPREEDVGRGGEGEMRGGEGRVYRGVCRGEKRVKRRGKGRGKGEGSEKELSGSEIL